MSNDEIGFYIIGILFIIFAIGFFGNSIISFDRDFNIRETTCKTLDLGIAPTGSENTKEINHVTYFKCTKDIYNSTTREIITIEKWVTYP